MNKTSKILFGLLLSVFLVGNINAQSMYSQAETSASEYVNSNLNIKTNYQRYLKIVDDNSLFYKKGNPEKLYSLGGLLSYEEFQITTKNRSNNYSYLFESDEYWTSTNDSDEKKVVAKAYKSLKKNELSNVRVTEYVLSNVRVNGIGTFSDPWIFQPQYIVTLKTNDETKGKLKESKTSESQEYVKLVMTDDRTNAYVYVEPKPGYQYLGNTCGIVVNDLNIRNKESGKTDMLIVQDITRDIECTINFGEKSDRIILYSYESQPDVPNELYVIKNKSWYEDSTSVKAITKLSKNPTMEGYEYKGYYTQKNKEGDEFTQECKGIEIINENNVLASPSLKKDGSTTSEEESIYTDGKTIYPCFKPKNYKVKYSCDGTTIKEERTYVFNEKTKLLSGDICEKTGYEFKGWVDEAGNSYNADSTEYYKLTTKESMTLNAIWEAKKYTITYYLGNASSTAGNKIIGTQECEYDSECTLESFSNNAVFPNSKEDETQNGAKNYGWSFYGWSNEASDLTKEYNDKAKFKYEIAGPLKLYAIGSRNIHFNGGIAPTTTPSGTDNPVQYWNPYGITDTYLTQVAIPDKKTISSWDFIGYRCGSNEASSNVTLDASLAGTNYKVPYDKYPYTRSVYKRVLTLKYDANGGSGTTANQTTTQYYNSGYGKNSVNVGASITSPSFELSSSGYTKTGYEFVNWTETKNASTGFSNGASYTFAPSVSNTTKDKTLYAKWNIINYTITYYVDGGTLSDSAPKTYNYNTDTITLMTPTKTDNEFLGWYTNSGLTGSAVTQIQKNSTGNKSFYAKWQPPTTLPDFEYTGKFALVKDNDTKIVSGEDTRVVLPAEYQSYTGNWKLRLLSGGTLTIYNIPNSSEVDIYLVGGGQGGTKGSKKVTNGTMYTTGSGGKGGYRKTYTGVSIAFGTPYSVTVGTGGKSSANAGGDSSIIIGTTTYKASSGKRSSTGESGGYEFDLSSYTKKYGGGGGAGCSVWSYSAYTCSGGSGKDGGGNSGSSGWSPNATGRVCKDDKGIVSAGGNGKANTGGGGGGGGAGCGSYILDGGQGGSGIVILRNKR